MISDIGKQFQSICTDCERPIPAAYVRHGDAVYLEKICPEHGRSRILASEDAEAFERWLKFPSVTVAPRVFLTKTKGDVPCVLSRAETMAKEDESVGETGETKGDVPCVLSGSETMAKEEESAQETKGADPCGQPDNARENEVGVREVQPATECPLHCGPCENHLMTACCVLLNVTDRCNQHCPYCFAEAGAESLPSSNNYEGQTAQNPPLSDIECLASSNNYERPNSFAPAGDESRPASDNCDAQTPQDPPLPVIERWLDRLVELGEERKFNIQISGGEPTVRDDLPEIISMCKAKGFEYIQLNTNGRLLAGDPAYAKALKAAGLSTVFLQFDGISDDVYLALRGEPLFDIKKAAIRNCGAARLPVSLVPTVLKNVNLTQVGAIIDFMLANISVVKGVHFQPASFFGRRPDERNADGDYDERVTMFAIMEAIEKQTGGRIKRADLAPISTGHPLCCFCAAFFKERNGLKPLSSGGSCCGPDTPQANTGCCDKALDPPPSSGGSCCGPDTPQAYTGCCDKALDPPPSNTGCCDKALDPLEIIRRDRDFVMNKWDVYVPDETTQPVSADSGVPTDRAMSFDEAIAMFKTNTFTISGMAFMDRTNLDAERLRRCRVQVFSPDERLVPFCSWYALWNDNDPAANRKPPIRRSPE